MTSAPFVRHLFCALLLCISLLSARAESALFIGNSFTYGAGDKAVAKLGVPRLVAVIADAKGHALDIRAVTKGGKNLSYHLAQPGTAAALASSPWDWLVLQDLSLQYKGNGKAEHVANAESFYRMLRKTSPQGRVLLYQTWPRGPRSSIYNGAPDGPEKMLRAIRALYAASAEKLEAIDPGEQVRIAPVGDAFLLCLQRYPQIELYSEDNHHASARGSYLAALVIYGTLFLDNPQGATRTFPGVEIAPDEAVLLQGIATEVTAPLRDLPKR